MLLNSEDYLKNCQLKVGDYCIVISGYAETFEDISIGANRKYHRIPLLTQVKVISVDEDFCTVESISESDNFSKEEIKQVMWREDLMFSANNLN
jgi:hypothetical protein